MNKEIIFKNTNSYEDGLIEDLKDLEEAKNYLEAALLAYEEDDNIEALLLALRHVAKAQGGIGQLAKRTDISRQHLYNILASKHQPRFDNMLSILSALGFRIRLEQHDYSSERTILREKTPA